jgi:hypothetical protein
MGVWEIKNGMPNEQDIEKGCKQLQKEQEEEELKEKEEGGARGTNAKNHDPNLVSLALAKFSSFIRTMTDEGNYRSLGTGLVIRLTLSTGVLNESGWQYSWCHLSHSSRLSRPRL